MKDKIVDLRDAIAILRDNDTLVCGGFGTNGVPDALLEGLVARFRTEGHPGNLTLVFGGGPGDGDSRGVNRLAIEGLLKRVIGGHFGLAPKLGEMAIAGAFEAYNLPLGCISHLFRDIAAGKPGTLSHVGLGTFVDPRVEGGKVNARTQEDIVFLQNHFGREYLLYRAFPISVAFIRGTTADASGNLTLERESLSQDTLAIAMAAKNSGGFVIVQVERIAERGSLCSRDVKIPGILVDCIVVADAEHHMQTFGTSYSAGYAGRIKVPLDSLPVMPLDERKVIARRAAQELMPNAIVNLGIGMPEGVAAVANEERIQQHLTLTAEPGVIGGIPAKGLDFGAAINADAIIDMNQQFDLYDGGALDLACLGLAQCDRFGNINVSRFGPKLAGAGGFINITQNAKKVIFAGTFTAGGLKVDVDDGRLEIIQEGRVKKFVQRVEQITFSSEVALSRRQLVRYVTERCVFALTPEGIELTEVAPGIDVDRQILALMDFVPVVRAPKPMDGRIFRHEPMGLKEDMLDIELEDRISYDEETNTLFLNFEALRIRNDTDVERIREAVAARCRKIGHKVHAVVNYDSVVIAEEVMDSYAVMAGEMVAEWYESVSRYTTSAFLRMKLGERLSSRGYAPHIFELPARESKKLTA